MDKIKYNQIKLQFWGASLEVTGSNFLVETSKNKILIDCGLFQGNPNSDEENRKPFKYDPKEINYLFVTHSHLDHIGRIPKLVKDGFRGKIISTEETKKLAYFILEDALKVMTYKERDHNIIPIYNSTDITNTFEIWETTDYYSDYSVNDNFSIALYNAGHILGSAMVNVKHKESNKSLLLTGDLGNWPNILLKESDYPEGVKYLVMESVYGDKMHEQFDERERKFENIVQQIIKNEGTLLIPSFSLERSQVVLFELNKLVENKIIKPIPIFFDSPLAIKLTKIYKQSSVLFNKDVQSLISSGDDIFTFPNLRISHSPMDSHSIRNTKGPKIIIAGGGMSQGGRIVSHEALYLSDKKNIVLLLGFQALGTLGRKLQEGFKEVVIDDKKITVNAEIKNIDGFSAHKDSEGLLQFVSNLGESVEKVFCAMGEPKAATFLSQRIRDYLDLESAVPKSGDTFVIDF